jgi:hypothetical protein
MKPNRRTHAEPLTRCEWDFRQVADEELLLCCYWEFGRESARIRAVYDPNDEAFFPMPKANPSQDTDGQLGRRPLKTVSVMNVERMRFFEALWSEALPMKVILDLVAGKLEQPFDHPWLLLPDSARKAAVEEVAPYFADKPALTYLPFNRCSDMRDLGMADEEYCCAEFDAELGIERLRVQIDWAGFTDAQIVAAFQTWVSENRLHNIGRADDRGKRKGKGLRGCLEWLAIMRVMHYHPFTSVRERLSEAWQLYHSADWPRSRKRAEQYFRELFPFLPPTDEPIHWPTAGRRSR